MLILGHFRCRNSLRDKKGESVVEVAVVVHGGSRLTASTIFMDGNVGKEWL